MGPCHVLMPLAETAPAVRALGGRPGPFRVGVECRASQGGPFEIAVALVARLIDEGFDVVPFGEPFRPADWGLPPTLDTLPEGAPAERARLFGSLDAAVMLAPGRALPSRAAELARAHVPVITNVNASTAWAWEHGASALASAPLPGALAAAVARMATEEGLAAALSGEAFTRLGSATVAGELDRVQEAWVTHFG
ncbi:MAG: hypothetical protein FJ086_11985 [Deltaproteobacteria bacterium]|nr:hypothetical protein [Deltaproteobacteria bacterium]